MYRPKQIRSKQEEKNNLTIIVRTTEKVTEDIVVKELRKAINRMNRLSDENISYEIYLRA